VAETTKTKKHGGGLMAIAVYKLVKGLGLLALGFGLLHYLHRDVAAAVAHWLNLLRVDPHNHYLIALLERVGRLDDAKLRELSVGTFFYAVLFLCEGTGLALRKRWAEYLTIVSTASLMPVEVYEIYKGPSAAKFLVLVVNVVVVAYLVRELQLGRKPRGGSS
jgi:uncharacterized membrane protein (DUF2068 family)